jgi:hypothetical protein
MALDFYEWPSNGALAVIGEARVLLWADTNDQRRQGKLLRS